MTLIISRHHLIDLIKEDVKLNYFMFGLQDLGLECHGDLLNLSSVVFKICEVDFNIDQKSVEQYYNAINDLRRYPFEIMCERLDEFSNEMLKNLLQK